MVRKLSIVIGAALSTLLPPSSASSWALRDSSTGWTSPSFTPSSPSPVTTSNPSTFLTPAAAPKRIISLVPSLTEAVCLLQACEHLVGVDRHSNWPDTVRKLPQLGGLEDTPLERIVALRPDLVLVPPSSRIAPRLRELGIRTLSLPTQTHADVQAALRAIGQQLQRSDQAHALWEEAQQRIERAAHRVPAAIKGRRVYVEVASDPYAAGPESFIGRTLALLGMANIVAREQGTFPRLNPEFVVRAQPDVIIATAAARAQMPQRPGWSSMRAASLDACGLPPAEWEMVVRPGPRLGEAAEVLADCLVRAAHALQLPTAPPAQATDRAAKIP